MNLRRMGGFTMIELNEQQAQRQAKAERLRARGIEPYPPRSFRSLTALEAVNRFTELEPNLPEGESHDPESVTVAGRVVAVRDMGKSIFTHLRDGSGPIQLYLRRNVLGDEPFDDFKQLVDLGDFLQASGRLFRTRTGEVTLEVSDYQMLSKAINPPPEKWHGLTDTEARFRQRYADLLSNERSREIAVIRSRAVNALRRFLDARGFLEVETPALQPLYGGAAARPFTTHYHSLDQTFYLRIADELYLKRLLVGGFERVYEISKDFRNEGIDGKHSPEFTMLEFYMAYADYNDVMDLTEQMVVDATIHALGEPRIVWEGQAVDLTPPWRRVSLRSALIDETGIDFLEVTDQAELFARARELGADVAPDTVWPRIVDELMTTFVRPKLIEPTFLIDYPVELSPLAKRSPADPRIAERFQVFIAGQELCNAFTELNDPMDQLNRFLQQARDSERGDADAMPVDEDFVNA